MSEQNVGLSGKRGNVTYSYSRVNKTVFISVSVVILLLARAVVKSAWILSWTCVIEKSGTK